jgi:hypothetical protein
LVGAVFEEGNLPLEIGRLFEIEEKQISRLPWNDLLAG